MALVSDTLSNDEKVAFQLQMIYDEAALLRVVELVCHTSTTDLTKVLTDKLKSISSVVSPNWEANPNFPFWALGIKKAAQSLIDQAKDYNDAYDSMKNDENASSTDHDKVLCIWKLYFATFLVQHLYIRLRSLEIPVDGAIVLESPVVGVTVNDCHNIFWQINGIAKSILDALDVESIVAYFNSLQNKTSTVKCPVLDVQKLRECIASEPVDITDLVNAITFEVVEEEVNLVEFIPYIVDKLLKKEHVKEK
ncbi:hypothetical protein H4219_003641 [Mycoemilia scoparia]|uniref:Uncharacterized protein n=1 Tax=Mycoemilia scoparia TaxID=417184 RepID=A0A9W8A0P3_9FUNG|nr:hypothetical protein H4219_003641 [Mycoemilia scoparia]